MNILADACGLVAAGAGVTIAGAFAAFEFSGRGGVLYEIGVVWVSGRFRSALALDFAAGVRRCCGAASGRRVHLCGLIFPKGAATRLLPSLRQVLM
jgi:hypothetical protein